jgi:hypothetical protein
MYVEEKKLSEAEIDEVGKILLDAADYIERHGWCQKAYQNGLGNVCIIGALSQVVQWPDDRQGRVIMEISPRLKKYLGATRVDNWNDALGRTKEQVVAALRGAARPMLPTPAIAQKWPVVRGGRSTLGLRKWLGFGIKP